MAPHAQQASANVTTVNLASSGGKKVQTTDDIMRAIESGMDAGASHGQQRAGELHARIQGRINEHEIAYGDKSLPRQRLPKVDTGLLDRYQAARQNVLVLGAIQQASKPNTHRSGKGGGAPPSAAHGGGGGHAHAAARLTPAAALASAATAAPPLSLAGGNDGASHEDADAGEEGAGGGSAGAGPAGAPGLGLGSAWTSFKSTARGAGSRGLGSMPDGELLGSAEPSGGLSAEASYVSTHSRASRRYGRQGSSGSMASRTSCTSSFVSASASAASSAGVGRRLLAHQGSCLSSSSSGGHTLRSYRAGSVAGSSHGGARRKGAKKRPPKPKPGRVTQAFAEFGSKDDWVSKTVLKHTLASIIQATWRGYHTRQRWKADRLLLVEEERARLCAGEAQAARLADMRARLASYQQRKLALAAAQAAAEEAEATPGGGAAGGEQQAAGAPGPGRRPGAASCAASRAGSAARSRAEGGRGQLSAWQSGRTHSEASFCGPGQDAPLGLADSLSDSDGRAWSDMELEDVAAIKFRAVTPPWQKAAEHARASQQLRQRTAAAAAAAAALGGQQAPEAEALWEWCEAGGMLGMWSGCSSENCARLEELRHRRICRKPAPVPLSAPAVAAAAAAGLLAAGAAASGDADAGDGAAGPQPPLEAGAGAAGGSDGGDGADAGASVAAAAPLPALLVEQLLLERYHDKYSRLGVAHKMPGRQRWLKLQQGRQAAAAGAAVAGEGLEGCEPPDALAPEAVLPGDTDSAAAAAAALNGTAVAR